MFEKYKSYIKTFAAVLAAAFLLNTGVMAAHRTVLQQGIAEEVVRFHVLANSDSEQDQNVKYLVRDAVLAWMQESQSQNPQESKADAEAYLSAHTKEIEAVADAVLTQNGMAYRARANLEDVYFPERTYGDCTFPSGWYEALRIKLGEAKGRNWWCVLYPNLCFSDCLRAVSDESSSKGGAQIEDLKKVLSAEEYESLFRQPDKWKITFRWF